MSKTLTVDVLESLRKCAEAVADPRKVVGIWATPILRRDNTVEEWKLIGVVTAPCALSDRGRL